MKLTAILLSVAGSVALYLSFYLIVQGLKLISRISSNEFKTD